jgi:hypothetical protein
MRRRGVHRLALRLRRPGAATTAGVGGGGGRGNVCEGGVGLGFEGASGVARARRPRDYRIRGPSYCKPTKSYYSTSAIMRCNGLKPHKKKKLTDLLQKLRSKKIRIDKHIDGEYLKKL